MTFPQLLAGEILTAAKVTARQTATAYKPVDQSVVSSMVLVDDLDLALPVEANAVYEVEAWIFANGPGDIKIDWSHPAGVAGRRGIIAMPAGSTGISNTDARMSRNDWSTDITTGGETISSQTISETGLLVTGGTAGTLQLRWAQGTSSATATIVQAGSYLRIRRTA